MSLIPDHGPTTRDQGVVFTFTSPSPSPQTCINTSWASPSAPSPPGTPGPQSTTPPGALLHRPSVRSGGSGDSDCTHGPTVGAEPLLLSKVQLWLYLQEAFFIPASRTHLAGAPSSLSSPVLLWRPAPTPLVTSCTSFLQTLAFSHQSLQDKNCVLVVLVVSPGTQ